MRSTCGRPSTATERGWAEEAIDVDALAARLRAEAGFLAPVDPLEPVGFGFNSHVFETASGWIVRIARVEEAFKRHEREAQLLPLVARHLAVAAPAPVRALEPGPAAPFGAFAYRALPGRLMTEEDVKGPGWETLAADLADAFAALHRIPVDEARTLGAPGSDFAAFEELRDAVTPALRARLLPGEWTRVNAWWEQFLGDASLREWAPALTHGDPWWGNMLVKDGRLSGIVDWEFLAIADRAWDLGSARQMGDAFHDRLVHEYTKRAPLDEGAEHRMAQWWALRAFFGVRFAADRGDQDEWIDSLRKLRAGPILG